MEIASGIEVFGCGLYVRDSATLIIADVHMGHDAALNAKGVLVPRTQYKETEQLVTAMLKKYPKTRQVIINGDIKHEFGTITGSEWRYAIRLIDFLAKKVDKILFVKGNHDIVLGPIAHKRNIEVQKFIILGDVLVLHGDSEPTSAMLKGIKTIIIGHEHPAITIRSDVRAERYKCFLKGSWKRKTLIVQPSLNPLIEGTDVLHGQRLSPLLPLNLDSYEVFAVSDKVYNFGKLKNLS